MFLSNASGRGKNKKSETMTLADLQNQGMQERSDITLDFEQFMRIYNCEKTRVNTAMHKPQQVALEKRPVSSFGKVVSEQKSRLMMRSKEIKESMEQNKSLIEDSRQRKRKQEDD